MDDYDKIVQSYIKYYHIRAQKCKQFYYAFTIIKIALAASIPVLQMISVGRSAVSAAPIVMIGILVMSIRMLIQIASTASLRPRIKPESGERNFIIAFRMASV